MAIKMFTAPRATCCSGTKHCSTIASCRTATYEEAVTPNSFEHPGTHNYGMGWRLMILPNSKIVYHNGWWHGNNTSFTRLVADTATIIILGNKFNKAVYAGMKIGTVFNASHQTEATKPLE